MLTTVESHAARAEPGERAIAKAHALPSVDRDARGRNRPFVEPAVGAGVAGAVVVPSGVARVVAAARWSAHVRPRLRLRVAVLVELPGGLVQRETRHLEVAHVRQDQQPDALRQHRIGRRPRRDHVEVRARAFVEAVQVVVARPAVNLVADQIERVLQEARQEVPAKGKIHRVDPDFGSTLTVSNRDSQSNCWVNWKIMGQPCEFQVCVRKAVGHQRNQMQLKSD